MSVGPAFARTVRHLFPDFNSWVESLRNLVWAEEAFGQAGQMQLRLDGS